MFDNSNLILLIFPSQFTYFFVFIVPSGTHDVPVWSSKFHKISIYQVIFKPTNKYRICLSTKNNAPSIFPPIRCKISFFNDSFISDDSAKPLWKTFFILLSNICKWIILLRNYTFFRIFLDSTGFYNLVFDR